MITLEKEYLGQLAARASYLMERKDSTRFRCVETPESKARMELWMEKTGKENFGEMLAHEHLTTRDALALCGHVSYVGDSLPDWETILVEIASCLPMDGEMLKRTCYRKPSDSPFVLYVQNCFLIYVYYAMEKLKGLEELYTEEALQSLFQSLVDRLASMGISVMQTYCIQAIAGETAETASLPPEERIKIQPCHLLLSGAYIELWNKFPVLARQLCENTTSWISWVREFTERFKQDFGTAHRIRGIRANISDAHGGGKSAVILEFDHGKKLVYKPHSLDMDLAFGDFCRKANLLPGIHLSHARADSRDGYGYVEFIPYESVKDKEEAELFFEHAGMLLGAMYVLGACDMHYENVIERQKEIYVIDTETVLQPGKEKSPKKSGMLRMYLQYSGETIDDFGALTNKKDSTGNLPVIDGQVQSAVDYQESLCRGFQRFYDQLMSANLETLKTAFVSCSPRTVLRNTNTYALLLNELNASNLLGDGFLYSCEVEKFSRACVNKHYAIYQSERRALLRRDIPVFYHRKDTCDLYDHTALIAPGFFEGSPLKCLSLDFLSEKDRDFQLEEIRGILSQKKCETTDMDDMFFKRLMADGRKPHGLPL